MDDIGAGTGRPTVVERAAGTGGELALRRAGDHYEIISNGTFLMDTRNGESERLLVRAAVHAARAPDTADTADTADGEGGEGGGTVRVLIGGLGVGFSLAEALALPGVGHVTVVEREPAVARWHDGPLRPWSRGGLDDPRTALLQADLLDVIASPEHGTFDAACLDIDNGPDWTVTPGNARLYGPAGLDLLARRLAPRAALAVWSAGAAPGFEDLLRARFARVQALPVPVPRGQPDIVYLAARPTARDAARTAAPAP